jgi:muconolactone delta-isomerase
MSKYQATIRFELSEAFMRNVPAHRNYINKLINSGVIDQYAVSIESGKGWITMNADSKEEIEELLSQSPLHRFWEVEIDELFVFDSHAYRFPKLVMN